MAKGDKNQELSYKKASLYPNVDPDDFIKVIQPNNKKRIFYRTSCLNCKSDRGYQPLKRSKKAKCLKCVVNGKYKRSQEQIEAFKARSRAKKNQPGIPHTDETKAKLSARQKEYCAKFGNQFKGLKHSQKTRAFLSDKNTGQEPQWKGRVFLYKGKEGEFKLRSSWELKFANWLDDHNIPWKYEPKFKLSNGMTFSPDFELYNGIIVEVKGYWTPKAQLKWSLFLSDYPNIKAFALEQQELTKLGVLSHGN